MNVSSPNELPYPLGLDAGNGARQVQDLAERLETVFNNLDTTYRERLSPPSWLVRNTLSSGSSTSFNSPLWTTVDFDATGTHAPTNNGSTSIGLLAPDGVWETWYVGGYAQFTGGTTLNAELALRVSVSEFDTVSGLVTERSAIKKGRITLTSGDYLTVDMTLRCRNARVRLQHYTAGAGSPVVAANSLFWAARVGRES